MNLCFKVNSTRLGSPCEHSPVRVKQADERSHQFVFFSSTSVENVAKEKTREAEYVSGVKLRVDW